MAGLKSLVPLTFLSILLLVAALPPSVHTDPALNLTVLTDKKTYYPRESVKVYGTFKNNSSPISNALVAIQVFEPNGTLFLFRTVTTGTVPEFTPIVRVKNISLLTGEGGTPTDTLYIPIPFPPQLYAYFLVTLESSEEMNVTFTLTLFDENTVCLGSDFSVHKTPYSLPPGNNSFQYKIPIHAWTSTGTATVCANLYTYWPYLAGYPLCPEKLATFQIVRGTETTGGGAGETTLQTTGTNGTYETNFRLSCAPKIGTYAVYSSSYGPPIAVGSTNFIVDALYSNPKAVFYWTPLNPYANHTVTFDASLSMPDGGTIVNYTWNFGDDTSLVTETDPVTTHVYTAAGNYTVTLNVTDTMGWWNKTSKTLGVSIAELYLTVITDKPKYYIEMDNIQVRGNLTFRGNPVADGLVALEIDNPNNEPIVVRTLKTGTDPISGSAVNITHLFLCNETTGEPLPGNSVKKGTSQAYFRVTAKNIGNETLPVQLTLNFYQNLYPLGWGWGGGSSLIPGGSFTLITPFLLPSWISVGDVTVYASVLSAFPRLGGYPYCEEKSSTFKIVDPSDPPSETTTSTTNPESNTNGTYNFVFKMPANARYEGFIQGVYTVQVSTYYGPQRITNSTTITVKLPGDANGDGWCDGIDLVMYLAPAFNSKEGDPNYNPNCDFSGDGWVDGEDLVMYLAPFFGKSA